MASLLNCTFFRILAYCVYIVLHLAGFVIYYCIPLYCYQNALKIEMGCLARNLTSLKSSKKFHRARNHSISQRIGSWFSWLGREIILAWPTSNCRIIFALNCCAVLHLLHHNIIVAINKSFKKMHQKSSSGGEKSLIYVLKFKKNGRHPVWNSRQFAILVNTKIVELPIFGKECIHD